MVILKLLNQLTSQHQACQIKALNQRYEFSMKTGASTHKTFLFLYCSWSQSSLAYYLHIMAIMYEKVRQNSCMPLSLLCWVTVALSGHGCWWVRIPILAERASVEEVTETRLGGAGNRSWCQLINKTKLQSGLSFLTHALVFRAWLNSFPTHDTQGLHRKSLICSVLAGLFLPPPLPSPLCFHPGD